MEVLLHHGISRKRTRIEGQRVNKEEFDNIVERVMGLKNCKYQIFSDKYNEFCDIESFDEIRDASKIKILTCNVEDPIAVINSNDRALDVEIILPSTTLRTVAWRKGKFQISLDHFDARVREELQTAMDVFKNTGAKHTMSWQLKHQLSTNVEHYLMQYTMYPTDQQYDDVCMSIIKAFPCLASSCETDVSGYAYLRITFYNRMSTKRRISQDDPECSLNAGIGKKNAGRRTIRAKKGESNFLPKIALPNTIESLGLVRDEILLSRQAIPRDDEKIKHLMAITYPRRRHELIVSDPTRKIETWFTMWPELADIEELQREMQRLNCVDFPGNLLDWLTRIGKPLRSMAHKSRVKRLRVEQGSETSILEAVQELPYLLSDKLPFYAMNENMTEDVYKSAAHVLQVNGVYAIKAEGQIVINNIPTFDAACWVLNAVYYAFNLKYPDQFRKCLTLFQYACGVISGSSVREVKALMKKLEDESVRLQAIATVPQQ